MGIVRRETKLSLSIVVGVVCGGLVIALSLMSDREFIGASALVLVAAAAVLIERRQKAEDARLRSEASFRVLIEALPNAVIVERTGLILYANPAASQYLGFSDDVRLAGRHMTEVLEVDETSRASMEQARTQGQALFLPEVRMKRPDGDWLLAEVSALPLMFDALPAVVFLYTDLTHRRRTQARLTDVEGVGTTVHLVVQPAQAVEQAESPPRPKKTSARTRVMLIDDEPRIAHATARLFAREFDICTFGSGAAALERLESDADFEVVLCDLMMPEMGGMDFYPLLCARFPALANRVVFVTGGAFTDAARGFVERVGRPVVQKPFEPSTLRSMINEVAQGAS